MCVVVIRMCLRRLSNCRDIFILSSDFVRSFLTVVPPVKTKGDAVLSVMINDLIAR